MKKILNASVRITLVAVFAFFTSCESFLEEEVKTSYEKEVVFDSEEGLEAAVNGMYSVLASYDYYGSGIHGLANPHSGRFNSNQTASQDATSLNCTPTNIWLPKMWLQMYSTINNANIIIKEVEASTQNFSNKNTTLGQAYFIRGLVYFDLVRYFGAVPLRTVPTDNSNIHMPKSSKQNIYQQIISDFEMAKNLLPETTTTNDRPKKWAAHVYLSKVYMNMAGEDGGNPTYWQNAKDELMPVLGKYSLLPSFASLFLGQGGNMLVENSAESIFEIQYSHVGGVRSSDMPRLYTPQNSTFLPIEIASFGRIRPNKEVLDQHLAQYPNDPRIASTFIYTNYQRFKVVNGVPTSTVVTQNIYPTQTSGNFSFPFMKKWLDSSYNGTTSNRNYILLRYADVLLMMAEIENELSGPANAYQYVNEVLTRARNSVSPAASQPANWSGMSQDEFRVRIMKERQYELLSEGQDWFDSRRRGYQFFLNTIVTPHNSYNPNLVSGGVDYIYPISVKNMLLPIPARELETNQAMTPADQNPGY